MKTYICTDVVTYKASNSKAEAAITLALGLKHQLVKGQRPDLDLLKAIKDHCRVLDRKYPRTRPFEVNFHAATTAKEQSQITIYSGDPSSMTGQPKAAVIYIAPLAGEIDMDKRTPLSIDFDDPNKETTSRKEDKS